MALRTESLTVRIDPRVKYLANVVASAKRLSLTSLLERALEEAINRAEIWEGGTATKMSVVVDEIWAEHEADRFVLLADRLPFVPFAESMTAEEKEVLWEMIQSRQEFWLPPLSKGSYNVSRISFNFKALREQWDKLKAEATKRLAEKSKRTGERRGPNRK